MCSITLVAQESTMATIQLTRATCVSACWQPRDEQETKSRPLRMSWIVVTDNNGNRHLRQRWAQ